MSHVGLAGLSGFALSLALIATLAVTPSFLVRGAGTDPVLRAGDYAVYTIGACGVGTMLYGPFFDVDNQIQVRACPVTLRWDVISVANDIADIRIAMEGWRADEGYMTVAEIFDHRHQLYYQANATLNAGHVVRVDITSMKVTTLAGGYVGRWGFHLTASEVAFREANLVHNWYNSTTIPAELTVTQQIIGGTEAALRDAYGVDTFTWATTSIDEPFPEGLEKYVYNIGGGWRTLPRSGPVYETASSLLLYCLGVHYSDILFNLFALIWLDDPSRPWPDVFPSSITLVDTNVFVLPGQGGDSGEESEPGVPAGGEGNVPSSPGVAWPTIALFAAVGAATALVAYHRLRIRTESGELHQHDSGTQAPMSKNRRR